MNILIISQYFWPENFRINDLALELSKRGHHVTILTGYPNYPEGKIYANFLANKKNFYRLNRISIIRVPIFPRGSTKLSLLINYLSFILSSCSYGLIKLHGLRFDKLLVYQVSPITVGLPAIIISKVKKAPIYFWVLDQWPDTLISMGIIRTKLSIFIFSSLSKFIYRNCAVILGQSESFLKNIQSYNVPRSKLYYFPNWAEENFNIVKSVLQLKEIKRKNNDFLILFAGNVGEAQDFDAVLKAANIMKQRKNIRWIIIGKGRDWNRIKRKIKELRLSSVEMLGEFPIERMPEFYAIANALLVCLKSDPLFSITIPGKIQTYLLSKKPILGMLDGEGANLIEKAKAGLTCSAGDYKSLAENALRMSQMSEKERQWLGENGRNYVKLNFDRTSIINSLEKLLESEL